MGGFFITTTHFIDEELHFDSRDCELHTLIHTGAGEYPAPDVVVSTEKIGSALTHRFYQSNSLPLSHSPFPDTFESLTSFCVGG
jgi:hypothetical protein